MASPPPAEAPTHALKGWLSYAVTRSTSPPAPPGSGFVITPGPQGAHTVAAQSREPVQALQVGSRWSSVTPGAWGNAPERGPGSLTGSTAVGPSCPDLRAVLISPASVLGFLHGCLDLASRQSTHLHSISFILCSFRGLRVI